MGITIEHIVTGCIVALLLVLAGIAHQAYRGDL